MLILANAGIPMLVLHAPAMAVAFIPVVIIEAIVYRRLVAEAAKTYVAGSVASNAFSTIIGIPVTWIALVLVEMALGFSSYKLSQLGMEFDGPVAAVIGLLIQSPWLGPYEEGLIWRIAVATIVLLVPYFFVSVFTERFILKKMWGAPEDGSLHRAVWIANGITYGLLIFATAVWLAVELI